MVKIYTKTGDQGTTSLFGGGRVDKNSARIRAYGEVDELNSLIGVIVSDLGHSGPLRSEASLSRIDSGVSASWRIPRMTSNNSRDIAKKLLRIQVELFVLGTDLATPLSVKTKIPRITKSFITRLEKEIDTWSRQLAPLRNFILPGGGKIVSKLHLARTVARRAERSVVDLANQEKINSQAQVYINRLSDWLFTLARYINRLEGIAEIVWKGRSQQ